MSLESQLERDEDALIDQLNDGRITRAEFNAEMKLLREGYREAARESAQEAYDRELERW